MFYALPLVAMLSAAPDAGAAEVKKDAAVVKAAQVGPKAAFSLDGFSTPESVLYDAESDTYLVSNINGSPLAKDNNGFISEVSPEGKLITLKLIAGDKGVTLNAPKGTAIVKGVLYVADIDSVRLFDRKTGAAKGEVKVPGATFLNDVAASDDGKVYVTDSALKFDDKGGFATTGTDGVYVIEPGKTPKLKTLIKSKDLKGPNGVLVTKDTIYVVSFSANELTALDLTGKKKSTTTLPRGGLDGIVMVGDELFISSWQDAGTVFRGKPAGPFTEFATPSAAPADIGFDSKRARMLVPHFMGNTIEALDTKP